MELENTEYVILLLIKILKILERVKKWEGAIQNLLK
jgi:hypothetical protein